MSEPEKRRTATLAKWLIPSVISGIVSIAAITQGYLIAKSGQKHDQVLEVAKLKFQVVQSVNAYDFRTAQILMTHVLKPIDDTKAYESFTKDFTELLADKAPKAEPAARAGLEAVDGENGSVGPSPLEVGEVSALTEKFRGPERLTASNKLIALYEQHPREVVAGLLGTLLPDENPSAYTVNLYVVFTLARIKPSWAGSRQQLESIKQLRTSAKYRDKTFKQRVEEAIENWDSMQRST